MWMLEKVVSWKLLGLQENVFIKKQKKTYITNKIQNMMKIYITVYQ